MSPGPVSSYPLEQEQTDDVASLDVLSGHGWQIEFPLVDLNVPATQPKVENYIIVQIADKFL